MNTSTTVSNDVKRRHDFVLLFDVTDGNPNGDPDAGNLPRTDPDTMQGLVTDVAIKRKVRDFVDVAKKDEKDASRYKIYVQHRGILANQQKRAFDALERGPVSQPDDDARQWMCENFYDIRLFGAVMTTGKSPQKGKQWNCGQVRGPVQLTFARSNDPINTIDLPITRVALTNAGDTGREVTGDEEFASSGQIGRKAIVPYGLYRSHGFFNPNYAKDTGATEDDLALFWQAIQMMWDLDHSAARGLMSCRGLYVFSHESHLGNAPAHKLFERVAIERKDGVVAPRAFKDYTVTVNDAELPTGVSLTALVG
ncbi:MAG: type I-C CRISPR-associated protein Cas7/Csd2 [Thermomicrobiales bacterium]